MLRIQFWIAWRLLLQWKANSVSDSHKTRSFSRSSRLLSGFTELSGLPSGWFKWGPGLFQLSWIYVLSACDTTFFEPQHKPVIFATGFRRLDEKVAKSRREHSNCLSQNSSVSLKIWIWLVDLTNVGVNGNAIGHSKKRYSTTRCCKLQFGWYDSADGKKIKLSKELP